MSAQAVRATLVAALEDVGADDGAGGRRLAAFGAGAGDLTLAELGLDSMGRMELLVALEMEHGVVIAPHLFYRFETLGGLVQRVLEGDAPRPAAEAGGPELPPGPPGGVQLGAPSRELRVFQRAVRGCAAVGRLEEVIRQVNSRLTPVRFMEFLERHRGGTLLPAAAPPKIVDRVTRWLAFHARLLGEAGKGAPEPFSARRIAPAAVHFAGPGEAPEKCLLLCFAYYGGRDMMLPQAVFLQHLDAARYDVLLCMDPWRRGFRRGAPGLGRSVGAVLRWIERTGLLGRYGRLRTFGCSAGAYPALLAARRFRAELGVCLAGRFPSERHLAELTAMYLRALGAVVGGGGGPLLFPHSDTKRRDAAFARRMARLAGGTQLVLRMPGREVGHNVLEPMMAHGEVGEFLRRTVLAPLDAGLPRRGRGVATMDFPLE